MKLLLTGEPHSGKSTLLSKIITNINNKQGFITKELVKDGQRVGFELISSSGKRANFASVESNSKIRVSRYGLDIMVLDNFLQELYVVNENSLLYIDEIGQMQLQSEKFREFVINYIEANNNFIGTISKVYDHKFINDLRNNDRIEIVEVNPSNRNQLVAEIAAKFIPSGNSRLV